MTQLPSTLRFRDLLAVLPNLPQRDQDFALSVMRNVTASGFRSCTDRQRSCLRDLYLKATAAAAPVNVGSMARIVDMFAKVDLKQPKLFVRDEQGCKFKLMPSTREPGSIAVFEDGTERGFRGTITPAGDFKTRDARPALVDALRRFACDPVKAAKLYGTETGACCFCGRELTDPQSVAVGYGPICADKWGLPHGDLDLQDKGIVGSELAEVFGLPLLAKDVKPAIVPGVGRKPWETGMRRKA